MLTSKKLIIFFLCLLVHVKEVRNQFILFGYIIGNKLKNIYFYFFHVYQENED